MPEAQEMMETKRKWNCPVAKCPTKISTDYSMCRTHWYRLTKEWRDEVWKSLRVNGAGAKAHIEVIRAAAATLE